MKKLRVLLASGFWLLALLASAFCLLPSAFPQQPQAQSGQPIFAVNAKYVNGVAPGYWPTAGSGLTLNLSVGTAFCGSPPAVINYAGGTLTMTASTTNYVYLNPAASCAPATSTTAFSIGHIPIATVLTGSSTITTITDARQWFVPAACQMTSAGAIQCSALGTNQNFTVTPSGTGFTILNGNVGIGVAGANVKLTFVNNVATGFLDTYGKYQTMLFDSGTASTSYGLGIKASTMVLNSGGGAYSFDRAGIATSMFIDPSGNVGIGTTGPTLQVQATKAIGSGLNSVAFSATPTFDASLGNTQTITLTGNVTSSTLSNAAAGETINFIICQDATGARTFVWPTNVLGAMTIGATASKCSAQNFIFNGTSAYALAPGVLNQ